MKIPLSLTFLIFILFYQSIVPAQTFVANHNIVIVDSLMRTIDSTTRLHSISSDSVLIDGTSTSWNFMYKGYPPQQVYTINYFLHTTFSSAIYDSSSSTILFGGESISKPWFNSDSALVLAEEQGGKVFRINNPHYKITAKLAEPLVPNATPWWYINYKSIDNPSIMLGINLNATDSIVTGIKTLKQVHPIDFMLNQNYPNPFNPSTTINYIIPHTSHVQRNIYDVMGKEVCTLIDNNESVGKKSVIFNSSNLSSGIYFYRLIVNQKCCTKKMILIR
jgi:hypothetical protein